MQLKRQRSHGNCHGKDMGRKGELACGRWNIKLDLGKSDAIVVGYEHMKSQGPHIDFQKEGFCNILSKNHCHMNNSITPKCDYHLGSKNEVYNFNTFVKQGIINLQ
jgi:hypothetical protein